MRVRKSRDQRTQQHHGGDIAHDVAEQCGHHDEQGSSVEVPALCWTDQRSRQSDTIGTADDDEQANEEDQQTPVHTVVDMPRLHGACDQEEGRTNGGHDRRRRAREKAGEHDGEHDGGFLPQRATLPAGCGERFCHRCPINRASQIDPVNHPPIHRQAQRRDGSEAHQELDVLQARK